MEVKKKMSEINKKNESKSRKNKDTDNKNQLVIVASVLTSLIVVSSFGFAWADTGKTNPPILATDAIKNDPKAMSILQNIELFKQQYAAQQEQKNLITEQQKQVDEKRKLAAAYLQSDLIGMSRENDQTSPKNAFALFITHVSNNTQSLFWDEYSFMQQKVQNGRDAMHKVLQNGGTMEEALQAYSDAAAIHKTQLVELNKNLNIKYKLADEAAQKTFDKNGKSTTR